MPTLAVHRRLWLSLLMAVVSLAACDPATPPAGSGGAPTSLDGTHWTVVAADALTAPVPGREPTLAFTGETASGTGGCNSFSGTYAYDSSSGAIAVRDLSMTAMACLDHPLNNFERAFFAALAAADRVGGDGLHLFVTGRGHRLVLAPRANDAPQPTD
jgi:heat shock protein HslJ